ALREKGSTVIFSTHRMESVEEMCDHIALINNSKKILEGTKKEIKDSYKSNTFIIEHRGSLNGSLPTDFEMLKSDVLEENFFQSLIRVDDKSGPNDLLKYLIQDTEVHTFIEKIPSINEIFIAKVEGGNHE
ncbi:MAG: DUF4162 domain-containing protein, partial [Fulvivirga sp.]|nr:DUF4162 domain-containing protein [Fulvivirga sp.]